MSMRSLLLATKMRIQRLLNLNSGAVTGATNASPIVITAAIRDGTLTGKAAGATVAGHGLSTGDKVTVSGVLGNTAANGQWTVTVINSTTFSLSGSTGNGAYTTGGTWFVTTRDAIVDVTDDGRPKPHSGQKFYGIVGTNFSNSARESLDEEYSVEIVVTLRAGYVPAHQIDDLITGSTGLWALVEVIRAHVHMNYVIMWDANENATYGCNPAAAENGFVQPLRFSGAEYLGAKGPDWFGAEGHDDAITGVAAKLRFDFARRVQVIEEQG